MPNVLIPAEKKGGRLKILNEALYKRVVEELREGRPYVIQIKQARQRTISDPLRRYYWAVVATMIAEETGHSKEMVHEALKIKILAYKDEASGLVIVPSVFSDGSTMTVAEKKNFIEECRRWAFDFLNLAIPDPSTTVY